MFFSLRTREICEPVSNQTVRHHHVQGQRVRPLCPDHHRQLDLGPKDQDDVRGWPRAQSEVHLFRTTNAHVCTLNQIPKIILNLLHKSLTVRHQAYGRVESNRHKFKS